MIASGWSDQRITDELFLAVVTRLPSAVERDQVRNLLKKKQRLFPTLTKARRACYEDMISTLFNSPEFIVMH